MSNILVKTFLKILLNNYLINKKSSKKYNFNRCFIYNGQSLNSERKDKMVDMYYRLVKAGLRTIQKVPDQFRDDVMTNLTTLTLDKKGKSIPTRNINSK
ncbi:hypothetical protein E4V42_04705 [Clostridium estertheticum]|uniref:Uncharacterized protein n=2 Tax=Clostridium estertheticum TaxID=238834 RepID=A0A5N7IY41_9CLOT|nr:CD1375 family protein [Clostridium estertheticum]MPQ30734.1 hypothetical protein [Clostridium estertheticum]MPQ61410.1 hypothetical protein [Clostridium estertheticum]